MSFAAIAIGATAVGAGASIYGAAKKGRAARDLRGGAKDIYGKLQGANEKYLSSYQDLVNKGVPSANLTGLDLSDISVGTDLNLSELDLQSVLNLNKSVDRTDVNTLVQEARGAQSQAQYGRLSGAEMQRDTVRQSTADAIARSQNAGGSALDLLGAVGATQAAENQAMRQVDIGELNRRQDAMFVADERVQRALGQRIAFDSDARGYQRAGVLAEFNAARQGEMFELQAGRQAELSEFDAARQAELTELQYQRGGELAEFDALRDSEMTDYNRDLMQFDLERDLIGAQRQTKLDELSQLGAVYGSSAAATSAKGDAWMAAGQGLAGVGSMGMGMYNQQQMIDLMKQLKGLN